MKSIMKKMSLMLTILLVLVQFSPLSVNIGGYQIGGAVTAYAEDVPYTWNNVIPEKTPAPGTGNGKLVLFDNSHGSTTGAADWVLDGAFSDFADALVQEGYTVREYRGIDKNADGVIRFYDDRIAANVPLNEAVITYEGIMNSDVFVIAEANRPFSTDEYAALKQYVDSGKGIYFIADHYNADRNMNTWDATEVFNGYNRSTSSAYNMGGIYGDLRNPCDATRGWLAENFGLRFRFNAVDYKAGVSGIRPPAEVEGLTQGAQPVLMAAGATLAIVDPTRAKGLVYFSASDRPVKWNNAVDSGLYYGGEAEGAYVAISKPSAGKAAFIGDSSPIEDITPKYRRENDGSTKKTYNGWVDAGNAAVLSVNIVNWLATPESYVGFGSPGHPVGTATPNPMAPVEMTTPQAEPWATPSYDPWNTDTFGAGSYGAPYGPSGGSNPPAGGTPTFALAPTYVYQNQPFAIAVGGTATNPQFGAYNGSGTQVGQLYLNNSWTSSGYNTITGATPLAATARVTSADSSLTMKIRTSSSVYSTKVVTNLTSGYGFMEGTVAGVQGEIVAASQSGSIVGTAQIDSTGNVRIAVKSGTGTTLALYGTDGVKKSDISGTYTINDGATTPITGGGTTVPVTGVTLNQSTMSLTVGGTGTLTATVNPSNATNKTVSWSSSNTSVAAVNGGTVTAAAAGTAVITVTTADGSYTASCTVTVTGGTTVPVTGVTLNQSTMSLTVGGASTLTATVNPSNATNKTVSWSSSNTSVAAVNGGTVTAAAAGTAVITVTTADGGYTASCTVTVTTGGSTTPSIALYPAYVYNNEAFAVVVGGTVTNPQFGAYNSTGTQVGQLYLNGAWTASGYNIIPGAAPLAATARVVSTSSTLNLRIRTSTGSNLDTKPVANLTTGYGYIQGAVAGQQGEIVAAVQGGAIIGTAQIDAAGSVKIAAKAGTGITLSLYGTDGVKKSDLTGTHTVADGATTVLVEGVSLDKSTMSLNVGAADILTAAVSPSNATNKTVAWSSSNTTVATVNGGTVTAAAAGTAVITAVTEDGGYTASCTITVVNPAPVIALYPSYVYNNEAFAVIVKGNVTNPQFGAYNSTGTQVGQLYLNGSWTASGYNIIPGAAPLAATARVVSTSSALNLRIRTSTGTKLDTKPVTNLTSGYGYIRRTVDGQQGEVVAAIENGVIIGTAQIDAAGSARIAVKSGTGITLALYGIDGEKISDLPGTYTVNDGATTVLVEGVSLNKSDVVLYTGAADVLTATINPSDATNKTVVWSSSNTSVAAVSGGTVTAVGIGTATITAATEDGGYTASCEVTVLSPTPVIALYPAYVYNNEAFAVVVGGVVTNPQFGAYNSTGTQVGQLYLNGTWTASGYNIIPGTAPLTATARVVSTSSTLNLRIRTSTGSNLNTKPVTNLTTGYGYIQGAVAGQQGQIVAAIENGVIVGTAQIDAAGNVRIAVKSGTGITLALYGAYGVKISDLPGTYTVSNGATTNI